MPAAGSLPSAVDEMTTTSTTRRRAATAAAAPAERLAWSLVAVALSVIGGLYAWARWPGWLPVGSDNDEYQLAGEALASFELPLIAGVEGTKYPLGYPSVLAVLEWLRLPVAPAALVLNLVALAVTVALVARLAGRAAVDAPTNPGAGLAAGALVVTSVSVWNDAYSVMPELALLLVVAGLLTSLEAALAGRRLLAVTALAVTAVLLKTLAVLIVVGGLGLLWLVAHRRPDLLGQQRSDSGWSDRLRARALIPAAAAVAAVLAGMAVVRSLPAHTTGYLATFRLRDPFDASLGELGPLGLVARSIADVPATLTDLGRAIALIDADTAVAVTVATLGLSLGIVAAHRLRPGLPLGPFAAGAVLAYTLGMVAWPYHSSRFGIPLVPIAALGVGWLVRVATDGRLDEDTAGHRWTSTAVGMAVAVVLVATSWGAVVDRGESAAERLATQHAALDQLEAFAEEELEGAQLVSFDYREVARHLDRPVRPLSYTTDTSTLLEQVGDADALVMVDIHGTRNRQLRLLLEAEPERFTPLLEDDGLAVYRVVP